MQISQSFEMCLDPNPLYNTLPKAKGNGFHTCIYQSPYGDIAIPVGF